MYYRLLYKNLITSALASLIILSAAKTCEAQGIVTLSDEVADEEDISLPSDESLANIGQSSDFNTDIPDTISEQDNIPLDDSGFISPVAAPATPVETSVEEKSEITEVSAPESTVAQTADENAGLLGLETTEETISETPQENTKSLSLGLETETVSEADGKPSLLTASSPAPLGVTASSEEVSASPLMAKPAEPAGVSPLSVNRPEPSASTPKAPAQPALGAALPQKAPTALTKDEGSFSNSIYAKLNDDLFGQMSDIEKQTTLLTLELRREKIRSEIEAVRAQRQKAEDEKRIAEEERKRKELEWQKEQEAKVLREQQALVDKEIELEKVKQKKALMEYMNQMLLEKQKWIAENAVVYKKMEQVEQDRKEIVDLFKQNLTDLSALSEQVVQNAEEAKNNHDNIVTNLTTQIDQLRKRIEAEELAQKNAEENPFSGEETDEASLEGQLMPINLTKEYAIMEITGKGDDLLAKLINKEGEMFIARKGTMLNSGYTVQKINPKYIEFDKNGVKDYLYTGTAALKPESDSAEEISGAKIKATSKPKNSGTEKTINLIEHGIPSLGTGMFVK